MSPEQPGDISRARYHWPWNRGWIEVNTGRKWGRYRRSDNYRPFVFIVQVRDVDRPLKSEIDRLFETRALTGSPHARHPVRPLAIDHNYKVAHVNIFRCSCMTRTRTRTNTILYDTRTSAGGVRWMRVRCACNADRRWVVQPSAVSAMRLGVGVV